MLSIALLLSLMQAAWSDSTSPAADPLPSRFGKDADSAWAMEGWSLQASYRSGLQWGDLRKAEEDMADKIGLTISTGSGQPQKPVFVLQTLGLEATLWRCIQPGFDLGLTVGHQWVLVNANSSAIDLLLSSSALTAQARWFPLRRLAWRLGPQLGFGALRGTLSRYPIEQDAQAYGPDAAESEYWLAVGNEDLDMTGFRVQAGGALEVRVLPSLGLGGSVLLARDAWTLAESDPLRVTDVDYPEDPVDYSFTFETHLAWRF